jgi:signal transduction histidine kinase
MDTVVLVAVDRGLAGRLRAGAERHEAGARVVRVPTAEAALGWLVRPPDHLLAVVVGPGVAQPVAFARRALALQRDLAVLVLAPFGQHEALAGELALTVVDGDARCRSLAEGARLADEVTEALARARGRRARPAGGAARGGPPAPASAAGPATPEALRRAEREREEALRRVTFLGHAGLLLAASLDPDTVLAALARYAVPFLGDWCAVGVVEDAVARCAAVAHADPALDLLAKTLEGPLSSDGAAPPGLATVLHTARPELWPEIDEARLAALATDDGRRALLARLGFASFLGVPLLARGRTVGALALAVGAARPRYTAADLLLAQDLAARAALAVDNARLYREARRINRDKDEFLAMVSHELRTPLHAILGWTRLLRQGHLDDPAARRALEVIERNTKAQGQLVEALLDVSRIVTGRLPLVREPLDPRTVLEAAVDSVRPGAHAKGIDVAVRIEGELGTVEADGGRLEQVVANLLGNALKFTPPGGRVDVLARRAADAVVIRVSDTGPGIAEDVLPYVFDRFRQGDAARAQGGLGLGLAIVRHVVEQHGGTVHAESAVGGAVFTVTLPARARAPAPEVTEPGAS